MRATVRMTVCVVLVTTACQQPAAAPEPTAVMPVTDAPPAPKREAPPAAEPKEAKAVVTDPTFELRIDPAGSYVSGQLARVDVTLEPKGGYHVNQEYPMSIELSAGDAVAIPKAKLGRTDAAKFGEDRAVFEVPLTPSAQGEHRVEAKVKFAVCTPETCVPDERTLALALRVE